MCGIAGSINVAIDINKLTSDLWHRGPDEQSTFSEGTLIFHHHRLSIVDIAAGKQPMHHNRLTIVFNGEIYNHHEVRNKYNLTGATQSDTETILLAYELLGPECLKEFDGMFAFAIYDREKNELFLARDRAGKKPLYYYNKGSQFVFASELSALKGQLNLSINEDHISQYLRMGYFYRHFTPYNNVSELPAGSFAIVPLDQPVVNPVKWWNIHDQYLKKSDLSMEEAQEHVDELLHLAVKRRVESSDLEVGSFLSGGIDSGIVSAIATRYSSALKTFTVSFDGEYDEAPLARQVSERYGTNHHEIRINFDNLQNDIEDILCNYGEPFFDSSAIPSYYVSREARKHLTVILNGDGGDEIFGGYRRYVPFAKYDFFNPGLLVKGSAAVVNRLLPRPNNKKSKYNFLFRLSELASKNGLDTYLSATIDSFEGYEHFLKGPNIWQRVLRTDFDTINHSSLSGLQKIMNLDFDNILAGNLLVKMDIATMAHSLEGRSPLLSKEIMEFVPGLPDHFKIKGKQTKHLLRMLSARYLPDSLIYQPKRGFEIPLKKWIDGDLSQIINAYLRDENAWCSQFVESGFITKLLDRKIGVGDEKRAKMIWTLFALEVWYQKSYKH